MHWFWRAVIAVVAGWVVARGLGYLILLLPRSGSNSITFLGWAFLLVHGIELGIVLTIYGLLTRQYYAQRPFDAETRCRQCGYILRGISEPRCPECGERI